MLVGARACPGQRRDCQPTRRHRAYEDRNRINQDDVRECVNVATCDMRLQANRVSRTQVLALFCAAGAANCALLV